MPESIHATPNPGVARRIILAEEMGVESALMMVFCSQSEIAQCQNRLGETRVYFIQASELPRKKELAPAGGW